MVSRQHQSLIISSVIFGVSVLLAAAYFAPDLNSPVMFLVKAVLQPVSFVILIFFLCLSLWLKKKMIVFAAILGWVINAPFLLPNTVNDRSAQESRANKNLKVATFSTLTRTENVDDIVSFIVSESPDLVCLQEVSIQHRKSLFEKLKARYPYNSQNDGNQVILSRFELTIKEDIGYYQKNELEHPDWGRVTVINAHMPRPYLKVGISQPWRRLFKAIDNQSRLILCGDLNITPNNTHYELLWHQYQLNDAHSSGYGFTYPYAQRRSSVLGVLIRIDYILTRGFKSFNTQTIGASSLSDHKAVVSELIVIEE